MTLSVSDGHASMALYHCIHHAQQERNDIRRQRRGDFKVWLNGVLIYEVSPWVWGSHDYTDFLPGHAQAREKCLVSRSLGHPW